MVSKKAKPALPFKGNTRDSFRRARSGRNRPEAEEQVLLVASAIGHSRKDIGLDIADGGRSITVPIQITDCISLKADKSVFEMSFFGTRKNGNLDYKSFLNKKQTKEADVVPDNRVKVWGGMLWDGRPFHVYITLLPGQGAMKDGFARIRLEISLEKAVPLGK